MTDIFRAQDKESSEETLDIKVKLNMLELTHPELKRNPLYELLTRALTRVDELEVATYFLGLTPEQAKSGLERYKQGLAERNALQCKIDQLMMEYCPDEISAEQWTTWGNSQRIVMAGEKK